MSKKPLLSIGMIVKNEIRCLERCLKALQPLRDAVPCELVIADTGSTDGTRELAAQFADILFDFEWVKDFSAARNAVMDRCRGEWYLSVDADEYLDDCTELVAFIRSDIKADFTCAYLRINNISSYDERSEYQMFQAQRMLNLATGLRYVGTIHERWPHEADRNIIYLEKTIFWHDGYAKNSALTETAKGRRNMELLEGELEKDPHNLLLLIQTIQSAYTAKQAIDYSRRAMDELHAAPVINVIHRRLLYRDVLRIAAEYNLPEFDTWLAEAERTEPDSLYTTVDISYIVLSAALKRNDYEKVAAYAERYLSAIERFRKNDYGNTLTAGPLLAAGKKYEESVLHSGTLACCKLKRWGVMSHYYAAIDPGSLSDDSVATWLMVTCLIWEKLDLWQICRSVSDLWNDLCSNEKRATARKQFYEKACSLFLYDKSTEEGYSPEKPPYPILAAMENCDLGRAAKIMLTDNEEECLKILDEVEDWTEIPCLAMLQLIIRKTSLPETFFAQTYEKLEQIAGTVGQIAAQQPSIMLEWDGTAVSDERPTVLQWRCLWTIAALRGADWKNAETNLLKRLVFRFEQTASEFLNVYFQPTMLCEENISALPGMYRFAWYFLCAMEAQEKGDQLRYISCLRKGLHHAPVMKNMVDFLIKHFREVRTGDAVSPELRELAEKVKTILAAYPADDPAVMALKATPAYQQVAFLIEESH